MVSRDSKNPAELENAKIFLALIERIRKTEAELQDVRTYGAKGNGINDDTPAFQRAANKQRQLQLEDRLQKLEILREAVENLKWPEMYWERKEYGYIYKTEDIDKMLEPIF